jgi:hypothetical protein
MREQAPRLAAWAADLATVPGRPRDRGGRRISMCSCSPCTQGRCGPNAATAPVDLPSLQHVVTSVHDSDRELIVWCPADELQTQSLVEAGVDAIVVDDVPRHVQSLSRLPQPRPAQESWHR